MQVLPQKGPHAVDVEVGEHAAGVVELDQLACQGDLGEDVGGGGAVTTGVGGRLHGGVGEDDKGADEAGGGGGRGGGGGGWGEPGGGVGGDVADEEVDVEGGVEGEFVDADVGVPFAVLAGGAVLEARGDGDGYALVLAFGEEGIVEAARSELVVGVVELFDGRAGVGGDLRGGEGPVADFGDGVAKGAGRAHIGGGVERGAGVGVEGREACVNVFGCAGGDGEGAALVGLRSNVGVRVDCLPDGEETIDVGVVEEEDWVKGAVGDKAHPSSYHSMNRIMDALQ